MSATINSNKLKFSVFGRGFEDNRNDSGSGVKEIFRDLGKGVQNVIVDNTETYFWIAQTTGNLPLEYVGKRRVDDLSVVSQSSVPSTGATLLFHPSNVSNNYGVAIIISSMDFYVFDMTDDSLITSGTSSVPSFLNSQSDCILVGQKIYIVSRSYDRGDNQRVLCIDLDAGTLTQTGTFNDGSCGFVDDDTIYGFFPTPWFSDHRRNFGVGVTGSLQWQIIASGTGQAGFPHTWQEGLTGNGFLWIPVELYGGWRFGKFKGDGTADFETPKPLETFGKFANAPQIKKYNMPCYTDGRENVAFMVTDGLFVSDFKDVTFITDTEWRPKALSEHYLFTSYGFETRIYKYK